MKTSSTTSTRPEPGPAQSTINRAMQYAAEAMLSPILRRHYRCLARSLKLRGPIQAAMQDFLHYEVKAREARRKL